MKRALGTTLAALLVVTLLFPLTVFAEEFSLEALPPHLSLEQEDSPNAVEDFAHMWGFETTDELMEWLAESPWGRSTRNMSFWEALGAASSADEFMLFYGLSEDDYAILANAWRNVLDNQMQYRLRLLEARGYTSGIINVMYNGSFISFPNAAPTFSGGTIVVPAAPFFGALGGRVNFDSQAQLFTATLDGKTVSFAVAEGTMRLTANGETRNWTLDSSPYVRDGVTFIPIREVAEFLGLNVFWDSTHNIVVVIDREKLIAEINRDFTIANRLINMPINLIPTGGILSTVSEMNFELTIFDSFEGDPTAGLRLSFASLTDGRSFSMSGTVVSSEVMNLMRTQIPDADLDELAHELPMLIQIISAMEADDTEIEIIFNYDSGMIYFRVPLLSKIFPLIPADTWLSFDLTSDVARHMGLSDITEDIFEAEFSASDFLGGSSVGEIVAPTFRQLWRTSYVDFYDEVLASSAFYREIFGDDNFTQNRGEFTLELTPEDFNNAARNYSSTSDPNEFGISITIDASAETINAISGAFHYRERQFWRDTRYAVELDIDTYNIDMSFYMHERNEMRMHFEINSETQHVATAVPTAPPDGARVISIEELLGIVGELPFIMPLASALSAAIR
ncbi:MAG: copper amine oxidase N-terminal domain-containing protein [Oscillospiraceae bacterium]|nr:copper amine oxidase N-terminal domain-containing protein [Oscillospiraceae bacterium]